MNTRVLYAVVCLLAFVSCNQTEEVKQPNILLLCIDDLRSELNCYGKTHIHSPNIDALASEGVLFTNHYREKQIFKQY